ncbi:MAG: hypothetical protein ABI233_08390 [Chthoniobacterales bacterium]
MTPGYLQFSNALNIFNLEWEARLARCAGHGSRKYCSLRALFKRFFRLLAGADLNGTLKTDPLGYTSDSNRGFFGLMYQLPLRIDSMIWVDT